MIWDLQTWTLSIIEMTTITNSKQQFDSSQQPNDFPQIPVPTDHMIFRIILFYYCYIFIVIIKSLLLNSEAAWLRRRVLNTNYSFTLVEGVKSASEF
jgi:hypothetical protein